MTYGVRVYSRARDDGQVTELNKLRLSYVLRDDGKISVDYTPFESFGTRISFSSGIIYPTVEELQEGKTQEEVLTLNLSGTSPAVRDAVRLATTDGSDSIELELKVAVGPADKRGPIATGMGDVADFVGVEFSPVSLQPANADAGAPVLAGLTAETLLPPTAVYFGRGIGQISTVNSSGETVLRQCN